MTSTDIEATNRIQLSDIDPLMQQGFPNLYQYIHLHQQAINRRNQPQDHIIATSGSQ